MRSHGCAAVRAERTGELAEQWTYALDHRIPIERATGYLMARAIASAGPPPSNGCVAPHGGGGAASGTSPRTSSTPAGSRTRSPDRHSSFGHPSAGAGCRPYLGLSTLSSERNEYPRNAAPAALCLRLFAPRQGCRTGHDREANTPMTAPLELTESRSPVFHLVGRPTRTGPTWVSIQDDLDLATEPAARAELAALLAHDTAPRSVLVHLGEERFVDVRGLRLLLDAARRARSCGGDLAVVAPPHCLRWMVTRLDLVDELFLADDPRQALRWARARG